MGCLSQTPKTILIPLVLVVTLGSMAGCLSESQTPRQLRGQINEASVRIDTLRAFETHERTSTLRTYQEFIEKHSPLEPITHYQELLNRALRELQNNPNRAQLSREALRGFPEIYMRELLALVRAHQGVARLSLEEGQLAQAEQEATTATKLIKDKGGFLPHSTTTNLRESYRLLEELYRKQGLVGKALVAKLSAELLDDHVHSAGGTEDFYVEKVVVFGKPTKAQWTEVQRLVDGVNNYRAQQNAATAAAVAGGVMAANAGIQQGFAQQALAQSGGVMTPQVQQAQMNAQMAQMQSQLFMTMMAAQAGANPRALQVNTTPWTIPTFTQQLVDPKQGVNTPTIMKGFAATAVQAGGASYQAGAQDVTQAVDALAPYRQSGKVDGATAQVEQFAEVFNAFLTQVQEIKTAK